MHLSMQHGKMLDIRGLKTAKVAIGKSQRLIVLGSGNLIFASTGLAVDLMTVSTSHRSPSDEGFPDWKSLSGQ